LFTALRGITGPDLAQVPYRTTSKSQDPHQEKIPLSISDQPSHPVASRKYLAFPESTFDSVSLQIRAERRLDPRVSTHPPSFATALSDDVTLRLKGIGSACRQTSDLPRGPLP